MKNESDHEDLSLACVISPTISEMSKTSYTAEDTDLSKVKIKSDSILKRSRKSCQWARRTLNKDLWKLTPTERIKKESNYNFSLQISNFRPDWGLEKINDFITNNYGPIDYIYMAIDEEECFTGTIKLKFISFTDCQKAWEVFHGKTVEEFKLFAERSDLDEECDYEAASPKKKRSNSGPWRPDIDIWEADPRGLYGFEPEYLTSLGIQPPLEKWVQVTNFRCDKSELKEVMELAGQVLLCVVDTRTSKIGHVMFSHPLEAVQAVSMLNGQHFYGQALKVTMEKSPETNKILPKGLQGVGPGLGADGNPIRDIVKQYERFVRYKSANVNSTLFINPDVLFSNNEIDNSNHQNVYPSANPTKYNGSSFTQGFSGTASWQMPSSKQTVSPVSMSNSISMHGPGQMPGPVAMQGPGPMSGPVGPMLGPMSGPMPCPMSGPMPGPMSGPMCGPMSGPMCGPISGPGTMAGPGPMTGPGPMPGPISNSIGGPMPGPMSGPVGMSGPSAPMFGPGPQNGPNPMGPNGPKPMGQSNNNVVELCNLPLSTTFTFLCEKMSECGQVMSVQLTTPGCAVVQFAQMQHAERCFQHYNNRMILGNRIGVKFL